MQIHLQSMRSVSTLLQLFPSSRAVPLPLLLLNMMCGQCGGKGASLITGLSSKSPGNGSDFIQRYWSDLVLATLSRTHPTLWLILQACWVMGVQFCSDANHQS